MRVIGTAGHVDHGKSTLVQRLTGIDPDRWKEEKKRGLTIDLGFAWFNLPTNETVGIVDVPGHRDFIENMLAGVGGIDAALLVIAADEGVMPQTREHLAILDLLALPHGLIILTKIDLIKDDEWLDLIELDIREVVSGTVLESADIIRVSAKSGDGIDTLVDHLSTLLSDLPPRTDYNHPRLPVDRVFSVEGFGTVVTGTLSGGTLSIGDTVEFQPSAIQGRVRGLQSYKQDIEVALPGSRVAVNVSGVSKDDVTRGDVLAYPSQLEPTNLIDVYFHHLEDIERPLKHNAEVKFFSGASETMATIRLLGDEILPAGADGWVQLRLRDAIPLTQRDRFILRYPSPAQTIGGGQVINPHPDKRWKRFDADVLAYLQTRMDGTPSERVTQTVDTETPLKRVHIQQKTAYTDDELTKAIETAISANQIIILPDETLWASSRFQSMQAQIEHIVADYHQQNPLRLGIPREELRSRLGIKNVLLSYLLERHESVTLQANLAKLVDFMIVFNSQQTRAIKQLEQVMIDQPYSPPSYKDAVALVGNDVLHALIDLGDVVQVSSDVLFTANAYQELIDGILQLIDTHEQVDAKQVRDAFNTSRKYAIAILEYLDSVGITKREGDFRVRGIQAKYRTI